MGGANKEVSTLRNCKILADPKGRLNSYLTIASSVFWGGAYGSLPDAAIWWCLRTGGGGILTRTRYFSTTVSSTIVFFGGGDFSRRRRDLSLHRPEKSRFLPLNYSYSRLVWEARGNHCHTSLDHQAHPRRCLLHLYHHEPPRLSSMDPTAAGNAWG